MSWMLIFFAFACVSAATIVAAFWDYRSTEEKKRRDRGEWKRATSTTMTSGKTGHVIITYEKDDR